MAVLGGGILTPPPGRPQAPKHWWRVWVAIAFVLPGTLYTVVEQRRDATYVWSTLYWHFGSVSFWLRFHGSPGVHMCPNVPLWLCTSTYVSRTKSRKKYTSTYGERYDADYPCCCCCCCCKLHYFAAYVDYSWCCLYVELQQQRYITLLWHLCCTPLFYNAVGSSSI